MQAVYCHQCAAKLIVGSRFCSKCGTSLASLSNKPEPPPEPPKQQKARATFTPFVPGRNDDDEDGESRYDNIDHLDIEINGLEIDLGQNHNGPEKLGGLVQAGIQFGPGQVEQRDPMPKMSQKKFLSEWAKEAGTMRKE